MLHRKPQVECCLGVLRWELCAGVNKSGQCLLPEGSGHPRLIKHGDNNTLFHHPIYCSSLQHHSAEGNSWQCAVSGCHDQCRMPQTPWTCTLHPCHPSECPISPQWHSQPKPWTAWMQQRSQIFASGGKLLWSKRSHRWRWPSSDTPDVWAPWQGHVHCCGQVGGALIEALEDEGGKGSACIFPALQASHTGSGSACESSFKPITR